MSDLIHIVKVFFKMMLRINVSKYDLDTRMTYNSGIGYTIVMTK